MLPYLTLNSISWMLLFYLLFLFQVQGEGSQKDLPSPRTSCPTGSKAYRSHCYALVMTPKSWFQADLACQKRPSGHLVSILSGGEASFVSSLVNGRVNNFQDIWIGLHDPTMMSEMSFRSLRTGVRDGCDPLYGCWKPFCIGLPLKRVNNLMEVDGSGVTPMC
ncbi:regenerating islet-derived protein 3-alpha isoform X2 [Apodemus sylvaticus]|uniref:regenerating islet-derived protein 3-alpha isoform X2 n=1 Tax=Apodemus sylvaticus TaxID=10129 RepID=UPI0022438D6D|nr:regenerating islet-derived protein 3-alpha isoform X2 [Apodemus sylvaticus]